ncbi:PREDICTED: CSC1-like protein At1g69450 [Tarenaya hassleriana]|uniref:CSC1-like protein At1g69450 n=1 Tax=Tarenaya hassleriana TaxID=28532 RepID=UPI00053C1C0E|nr:PREDICTED: CSC1-like protein At1g69450 [Tarenaya hassleriana]
MLVSALLMSVGINSTLCVLFFILYSILRKQPDNYEVFLPRRLAAGTSKNRRSKLARYMPSVRWISKAWRLSESELLESSGLDGVVFMRMITFSLKVFLFAGIIGVFVLLPVNCSGDQLHEIDFIDWSNNSLDLFSISNIKSGSPRLWFHFGAIYIVTAFVCCLLYYEFRYISLKRIEHFGLSRPQPQQFTILVRNIPASAGNTLSDTVDRFFRENHPSTYHSHVIIRRTSKLQSIIGQAKKLYKRQKHVKSNARRGKNKNDTVADQYEKKLLDLEQNVRMGQAEVTSPGKEVRAAFVSFKSRYGAAMALHMPQSINPTYWLTEPAPEPHDVHWPFISASFMQKWLSKIVIVVTFILLTVLFLIPVVVVQGLTNLTALEYFFPFLKLFLTIKFVSQIVTGYLPSLILQMSLKVVPPVMEFLSSIQGHICHSDIQKSACNKVIWFMVWNVFFATVFSGSAFHQISVFLDPKDIITKLAVAVPAQASFFIAYVVTTGWTSILSELFRVFPFICSYVKRSFEPTDEYELEIPSMQYHRDTPRVLFFGLLGITYFFLAPVILPFLLVYLCLAFIIYRNQFMNVYGPKYETAGKFWPIVHYTMIFSLVLMHAIGIGVFAMKKMELATYLLMPLPLLTLLFNEYCRKRFMPVFFSFPAEVLTKRDREDRNDPNMSEFYSKLVTAYQDPALLPFQFSPDRNSLTSPLLSSPQV